jgi:hypothetical protein
MLNILTNFSLIYLLETYQKSSKYFYLYTLLYLSLYLFTVQYLNHIDLRETKISKLVAIFISISLAYVYINFKNQVGYGDEPGISN